MWKLILNRLILVIQNGMSYKKKFDTWREENTKG